jgi:hypothetical protein
MGVGHVARVFPQQRLYKLLSEYTPKLIYGLPLAACAAAIVYSTPSVGVYWQTRDRSMKPLAFAILYGEEKNSFLGSALHD